MQEEADGYLGQFIDNWNEWRAIKFVEGLTDGPDLHEQLYDNLSYMSHIVGAKIVNKVFKNSRRGYGRFDDKTQEVWYCAFEHDTAVKEKAYQLKCLQEETGEDESSGIYREVFADFTGAFHDARELPRDEGILGPDPETSYPLGQELAHKLRAEGGRGIVYPSVRDPNGKGNCLVAFHREIVQNTWYGSLWKMSWSKEGKLSINEMEKDLPSLTDLQKEGLILP